MGRVRSQSVWAYLMTILLTVQVTLIAAHIHVPHNADEMGGAIHAPPHAPADHTTPNAPADDHQFCPLCWLQHASGDQLRPSLAPLTLPDWLTAPHTFNGSNACPDRTTFPPFLPRAPPGSVA